MHDQLRQIASSQGGGFTAQQARRFHRWSYLQSLVVAGVIEPLARGRFRVAGAPDDLVSRILRAQSAIGEQVVVCCSTAAALHGFGILDDGLIHVTTASAASIAPPPGAVVHQRKLRSPAQNVGGLLATAPADTAIDVACAGRAIDVLAVLDAFLRWRWVEDTSAMASLGDALQRAKRQRGICQVARWLNYADPRAESPMESRTRFRVLDAGLPPPDLQILVETAFGRRFLDMGWRGRRVGVDFEGEEFHTGTGAMARDRMRHNAVTDRAWTMFYPTARDVYVGFQQFTAIVSRSLGRTPTSAQCSEPIPRPPSGWRPGRPGPLC